MAQATPIRNPFMLMLHPEVVLAAVENSARLSQLNRHLCRPLDRPVGSGARHADDSPLADDGLGDDEPLADDAA
jgi:hypothetical protein